MISERSCGVGRDNHAAILQHKPQEPAFRVTLALSFLASHIADSPMKAYCQNRALALGLTPDIAAVPA